MKVTEIVAAFAKPIVEQHDLEITIITCNHQELLQSLWRLWQSVELVRIHTTWHHEIASTLRCRTYQIWSLDLKESLLVEECADRDSHAVAKLHITLKWWPAQIEVTILHS